MAEVIDELGIEGKTIGVAPVGCAVIAYNYLQLRHDRGGARPRARGGDRHQARPPEHIVFTYQGDGDLASIGMAETVHAATRGENITIIFVNNAIYGMTGGQMAPTTPAEPGDQTCPYGRDVELSGYPIRVSELLSSLDGPAYIARVSVDDAKNVRKAKKAIKKAFETQIDGKGYSLVEVRVHLPDQLGHDAPGGVRVDAREHAPVLPAGRVQGRHRRRVRQRRRGGGARAADCPIAHPEPEGGDRWARLRVLAGFGGQGLLFAGKVIAMPASSRTPGRRWLPSYGPEMRGGTANCSVCLSDEPIGSPLVLAPDALIAMNQPSIDKFAPVVTDGGVVVADMTLIGSVPEAPQAKIIELPATQMAEDAGFKQLANIICAGRLWAETRFCEEETLFKAMEKCVPARKAQMLELNKQALRIGMEA